MDSSSKDRESFVYVTKLAEQAERYDGLFLSRSVAFVLILQFFAEFMLEVVLIFLDLAVEWFWD